MNSGKNIQTSTKYSENSELQTEQRDLQTDKQFTSKPYRLTKSEIEQLRKDKKETSDYFNKRIKELRAEGKINW